MGFGAVEAMLDAGKKIPPITADDWNGWLRMAKQHNIDFLAVSGGNPLALTCVDLAVKILNGEAIPKIVEYERRTRDTWLREDRNLLEDRVHRALGMLCTTRRISSEEMMDHLSAVRMGIHLAVIDQLDISTASKQTTSLIR